MVTGEDGLAINDADVPRTEQVVSDTYFATVHILVTIPDANPEYQKLAYVIAKNKRINSRTIQAVLQL